MTKQPVKLALNKYNEFSSKQEYLKARKEASKRGNRLLRHRYKQVLLTVEPDEFSELILSSVFG